MNKNGTEKAYYLGLLMPLEGATTDSRTGCLKKKKRKGTVRIKLQTVLIPESKRDHTLTSQKLVFYGAMPINKNKWSIIVSKKIQLADQLAQYATMWMPTL